MSPLQYHRSLPRQNPVASDQRLALHPKQSLALRLDTQWHRGHQMHVSAIFVVISSVIGT